MSLGLELIKILKHQSLITEYRYEVHKLRILRLKLDVFLSFLFYSSHRMWPHRVDFFFKVMFKDIIHISKEGQMFEFHVCSIPFHLFI